MPFTLVWSLIGLLTKINSFHTGGCSRPMMYSLGGFLLCAKMDSLGRFFEYTFKSSFSGHFMGGGYTGLCVGLDA